MNAGTAAWHRRANCPLRGDAMYAPVGVKTSTDYPIPDTMKAWVLGNPG